MRLVESPLYTQAQGEPLGAPLGRMYTRGGQAPHGIKRLRQGEAEAARGEDSSSEVNLLEYPSLDKSSPRTEI